MCQRYLKHNFINKPHHVLLNFYQNWSQTALTSMFEEWRQILDKTEYGNAVLIDFSKAFDTINHELLLARLHAYMLVANILSSTHHQENKESK